MKSIKTVMVFVLALTFLAVTSLYVFPANGRGLGDITALDGLRLQGAFGTATPQFSIVNEGSSQSLEVRNSGGTPVFQVNSSGALGGQVLTAPTPGQSIVCGTTTVTGTSALTSSTHGMATPIAAQVTIAEDVVGDGARASYTNSAGTITLKVWNSAATPAASAAGHVVSWCVRGTR